MCFYTAWSAERTNGSMGFPLDDPWIHLQFARNLHDYGSFSYYKNDMVTSGSTSPLFTFMLAVGFFVTSREILLGYVLGVTCFLAAGWYMFQYARTEFDGDVVLAAGAAFLLLFEPRLQWIALSGMETTLFLLLLIASLYYHRKRNPVFHGVATGLLIWARPDAVILILAVLLDAAYHSLWARPTREGRKPVHRLVLPQSTSA